MQIICAHCRKESDKPVGAVNRARKVGLNLYCDRRCAGLARRLPTPKTKAQKVEEKRLYDIEYRRKNALALKDKKRAYYRATYDPALAAVERKRRMPWHVEYCRRPEYKRWKRDYDTRYRARKFFGEFADSALLLTKIDHEVNSRMSDYDVRIANGTLNKRLKRRREYERLISDQP